MKRIAYSECRFRDSLQRMTGTPFLPHLGTVFGSRLKQTAELRLRGNGEAVLYTQFESIVSEDYGDETSQCRTAVIDITEHKQAGEKILTYQKGLQILIQRLSLLEERQRKEISEELHD
ncbi:MAG: hypothetical protein ABR903_09740, partial [Thermodesulfovibrionales bacterium]